MSEPSSAATHELRPRAATWTHVALRVRDIDASIHWYEEHTPLRLLDKRSDEFGFGAWLGQPETAEQPFILVLAQFFPETDPYRDVPTDILAPFAHIGIELPSKDAVDEAAAVAERSGSLTLPPQWLPPPVGYVCMVADPDGNNVEFSYDQGVYETARRVWGS